MESAQQLDFKLYLEGVPVEFESATVNSQIGSPAMAHIRIPPTIKSQKILPRTSVHLFYSDPNQVYGPDAPEGFEGTPVFKLLFEGEVMGISYRKTDESRSTTLVCADITNNFDYAHRYVIQDIPAMLGAQCEELTLGRLAKAGFSDQLDVNLGGPIARLVTNGDTIVDGVQDFIRGVFVGDQEGISTNEFLESVENRFKITERVLALEDEDIKKLAQTKAFLNIMSRSIGRTPPSATLTEMINIFLSFIYYNRISILSPSFTDSSIKNFLLLPNIYFSPPPKCNVLFPEHIENLGYSDMFLQTPTRLFLQTSPFGTPQNQAGAFQCASTYAAPREIANLIPSGSAGRSKPRNNTHRVLTSEEKLKGIIPIFKSIGQPEYVNLLGQRRDETDSTTGTELDSLRNYLLNMAEYELEVRKAQTRILDQMTGPFNPGVIVGAPVAVLDDVVFIFGILGGVTHNISSTAGATTNYAISLSRRVPIDFQTPDLSNESIAALVNTITEIITLDTEKPTEEREKDDLSSLQEPLNQLLELGGDQRIIDIVRRLISSTLDERLSLINQYFVLIENGVFENLPEVPRWVNSKFSNENASESYSDLFGCDSVMTPVKASEEGAQFRSIAVAVNDLFNVYKSKIDRFDFTKRYTKRSNITTQLDFNNFYNLPDIRSRNIPYPASGPFTASRQGNVLEYFNDLKSNRAHIG